MVYSLIIFDDLKLFAKNRSELELLLNTVRLFSDTICMSFVIQIKVVHAFASVIRGKLAESTNVTLSMEVIPALVLDSYTYVSGIT